MGGLYKRKRFTIITIVYWFLLIYILTALFFWFFSLMKQNSQMAEYKILQLKMDDPAYITSVEQIQKQEKSKMAQYIGEGVTFMLLILLGAVFVYRATRRQIRLNDQQQNFMMAVTHELKTPIAVAKLNLETLVKRRLGEAQQEKLIANTLQEANRLNVLCDNILLASQIDSGHYFLNREEVNLSDLVNESCISFQERFPLRTFHRDITEAVYIKADSLLIQLAVNNLIENAIKYSDRDKPIMVELVLEMHTAQIRVKDLGLGINDEEKRRVFDKFYRTGSESTRKTKGTGLGLYLTAHIIKSHKGTIKIADNTPSGCIFVISLPTVS